MQPQVIYSPEYDIRFFGMEKLHVFDSCKYSKAWKILDAKLGHRLKKYCTEPQMPATIEMLRLVHSNDYLDLLRNPQFVAQALEIPLLSWVFTSKLIEEHILKPMLFAVMGTVIAAEAALETGIAVNLSGGYHHASRNRGEGFCIYSDIAIAVAKLRALGKLKANDQIVIIDLDAHQGNGLERIFYNDKNIHILDMYNQDIYPRDEWAKNRIDCNIPLISGTQDELYLMKLKNHLLSFINSIETPRIVFYNAGTDIYMGDKLGNLKISTQGVFNRDKFVFNTLSSLNIPWIMLLSGGYSWESHRLVAESVYYILEQWGT